MKIGVLGGIGPEATGQFYNRLIERLQRQKLVKSNRDYPQIVINSIPAPELIGDAISNDDLKPYVHGLKELAAFGVDFVVMVCNTIHLFRGDLQSAANVPIVDLRKAVEQRLAKSNAKTVLVIGTSSTVRKGLYKFNGITTLSPNKKEIKQLAAAIFNFNKGVDKNNQIRTAKRICDKYLRRGAECVILGCTEFAAMLCGENVPKIDTIDVLVDATIEKIRNK